MNMRTKYILVVFGLILLFGIVTIFNTMTQQTKQPTPHKDEVRIDEDKAIQHLSASIAFKTVSYEDHKKIDYNEFNAFIRFLQESYPRVYEKLQFEKVNDYALLYKWKGTDSSKKPIGFTSHYDVVPVLAGTEGNWEQDPFSGAVVDGKIWGRGTLDDKIGVIGILEAIEYLISKDFQPTRDMYFMFGFDEEIGGDKGANAIANSLKEKGISLDFVIDEGGAIVENMVPGVSEPVGVVGISEKGSATVELSIEGSGGHSSQPKNHTNIGRIAKAIAKLEDKQFKADLQGPGESLFEYVSPEMSFGMKYVFSNTFIFKPLIEKILLQQPASAALIRSTIAPTIFQAGEQSNVLPEEASAIINVRLMPGESIEEVKTFIEDTIHDDEIIVTVNGNEATKVSSINSWQFEAIQQAMKNVYPNAVSAPYLMFAGSDARHYDEVSENTYRFLPVQITSDDLNRMHGTNEQVTVDNYMNAIKFYIQLMKETSLEKESSI